MGEADLSTVRELARAAVRALEASRRRLDDLNVYPVPDGDTGTNLLLTARAVLEALESSRSGGRAALAAEVTRAALLGGRGNSGVILSQITRGAADSLAAAGPLDRGRLAAALRAGSDAAYRAVRQPVEGTMLTAIREMAEAAEQQAPQAPSVVELLRAVTAAGEAAVARTPDQLEVLRQAGVVDAGAAGVVEIVRGLAAALAGEPLPAPAPPDAVVLDAVHQELSRYRYCTTFVLEGESLDAGAFETALTPLGDSLFVVGDSSLLKVHLHTDDPGAALSAGSALGTLERVEVANMHRQTVERAARLSVAAAPAAANTCDVVAVAVGEGNRALFASLGAARVVSGGATMNPSAAELLGAVDAAGAAEVLLLPNDPNVVLSAEQAAALASKRVRVVPTRSLGAGLAAMVAFDASRSAEENAVEMADVLAAVVTGAVAVASRPVALEGGAVQAGDYLGLLEGEPVAGGTDFDEVAAAVAERLLAGGRAVVTLLTGAHAPAIDGLVASLEERHPELELAVHDGGQPHYPLLLWAE